ncbi:16.0 kDa heat shock protein, peroxisomal-like [Wolffia australiana]
MAGELFGVPLRRLFFGGSGGALTDWRTGSLTGEMDWIETPSAHFFKINVPGLGKDEVKVQLEEGGWILVQGEPKEKTLVPRDATWRMTERGKGELAWRFCLPDDVKQDQIKAQVNNGLLTLVASKELPPPRPKTRSIAVTSKL